MLNAMEDHALLDRKFADLVNDLDFSTIFIAYITHCCLVWKEHAEADDEIFMYHGPMQMNIDF